MVTLVHNFPTGAQDWKSCFNASPSVTTPLSTLADLHKHQLSTGSAGLAEPVDNPPILGPGDGSDGPCATCGGPLEELRALVGYPCLACYQRARQDAP